MFHFLFFPEFNYLLYLFIFIFIFYTLTYLFLLSRVIVFYVRVGIFNFSRKNRHAFPFRYIYFLLGRYIRCKIDLFHRLDFKKLLARRQLSFTKCKWSCNSYRSSPIRRLYTYFLNARSDFSLTLKLIMRFT